MWVGLFRSQSDFEFLYNFIMYNILFLFFSAYKLAMVMIKVIVAKFLFNYKVECDCKNMEEIKFRGDFTIKFEDQVFIKLFQRNDGEYQHGN